MIEEILAFQPEYFGKFKCDGTKCDSHCCKGWIITIDKQTYKKYSSVKPKSAAKNITSKIPFDKDNNLYKIKLKENGDCPFLCEDKLCFIQRNYGEDFLSMVCSTYPRIVYDFGDLLERSLTITCPLAAELVLSPEESLAFEQVTLKIPKKSAYVVKYPKMSPKFIPHLFEIQFAAISILQERKLNIDQRLATLGFFLDSLDELAEKQNFAEIEPLSEFYTSGRFLNDDFLNVLSQIEFKPNEFVKFMFGGVLESLYGGESNRKFDNTFLQAVTKILKLQPDENDQISVREVAEIYSALATERKNFVQNFSSVFENYLVNEFFLNNHPYKVAGTIRHNYGVFVAAYKIVELFSFCAFQETENSEEETKDKKFLIKILSTFANRIDHNVTYLQELSKFLQTKENTIAIISSLLET